MFANDVEFTLYFLRLREQVLRYVGDSKARELLACCYLSGRRRDTMNYCESSPFIKDAGLVSENRI